MGVGLVRSLQPPDILWIHWRVYNSIANTSKGVLFCPLLMPMSNTFSISFNKTLLHKSSEWSSLVSGPRLNSSPPEAKNPNNKGCSATTFQWNVCLFPNLPSLSNIHYPWEQMGPVWCSFYPSASSLPCFLTSCQTLLWDISLAKSQFLGARGRSMDWKDSLAVLLGLDQGYH